MVNEEILWEAFLVRKGAGDRPKQKISWKVSRGDHYRHKRGEGDARRRVSVKMGGGGASACWCVGRKLITTKRQLLTEE